MDIQSPAAIAAAELDESEASTPIDQESIRKSLNPKLGQEIQVIEDRPCIVGSDPRNLDDDVFEQIGHTKMPILKVIRSKCLDCCGGADSEVRRCPATTCELWPYRMATNPFSGREMTDEQRAAAAVRLAAARRSGGKPASAPEASE